MQKQTARVAVATTLFTSLSLLAWAHHAPDGLSHQLGTEFLTEVTFHTSNGNFGVPPYVGTEEFNHGRLFQLSEGDGFRITTANGAFEDITFRASDFADITRATHEEVISVVNASTSLVEMSWYKERFLLEGAEAGPSAGISLENLAGNPLPKLKLEESTTAGADDLALEISIPAGTHAGSASFVGHPYLLLASTTDGSFQLGGHELPLGLDATSVRFFRATRNGGLPAFTGVLNGTEDAVSVLPGALLQAAFGTAFPERLYLAYVILNPADGALEYVSNRFTVRFDD